MYGYYHLEHDEEAEKEFEFYLRECHRKEQSTIYQYLKSIRRTSKKIGKDIYEINDRWRIWQIVESLFSVRSISALDAQALKVYGRFLTWKEGRGVELALPIEVKFYCEVLNLSQWEVREKLEKNYLKNWEKYFVYLNEDVPTPVNEEAKKLVRLFEEAFRYLAEYFDIYQDTTLENIDEFGEY